MQSKRSARIRRVALYSLSGTLMFCLFTSGVSALINQRLAMHSEVLDQLGTLEKAQLAEAFHLRQTLGNAIWPGWGDVDIPILVYNEQYAFLVGYPEPPSGWLKMPQREARGGAWEVVPNDKFNGQLYYRQRLTDPKKIPEGFTVLVGDRWVATFQTKKYSEISFYSGLREQFPPLIREVVPYALLWNLLSGESEAYITLLLHESFHAYQASVNPGRFAVAEEVMLMESKYPWEETSQRDAWQQELDLLVDAATASSNVEAKEKARQFLSMRDTRRTQFDLSSELISFERQREWLEGLAKYAELTVGRTAAATPGYEPLPSICVDPEFNYYATRDRFWSIQLNQVRQILKNEGEIRFYYSGFAQAVLLDRVFPSWKKSALSEEKPLESWIKDAVSQP